MNLTRLSIARDQGKSKSQAGARVGKVVNDCDYQKPLKTRDPERVDLRCEPTYERRERTFTSKIEAGVQYADLFYVALGLLLAISTSCSTSLVTLIPPANIYSSLFESEMDLACTALATFDLLSLSTTHSSSPLPGLNFVVRFA